MIDSQLSMSDYSEPKLVNLGLDHLDEAAEVLTKVFIDYPLDHYIMEGHGEKTFDLLFKAFRMDCLWKVGMSWPFIGVQLQGKLAAVLLVRGSSISEGGAIDYDGSPLTSTCMEEMEDKLNHSFGERTCGRILEYYAVRESNRPHQPHLYIESIATLPEYRGKGYGGMLLNYVGELSKSDVLSTGVGLDTQDQINLAIYYHFGYHVTGEGYIGPVKTWYLFRPD